MPKQVRIHCFGNKYHKIIRKWYASVLNWIQYHSMTGQCTNQWATGDLISKSPFYFTFYPAVKWVLDSHYMNERVDKSIINLLNLFLIYFLYRFCEIIVNIWWMLFPSHQLSHWQETYLKFSLNGFPLIPTFKLN